MSNAAETKPLKVLLVAEHASAEFGGEALLPFQYFKYLREMGVDVHLLVHERTQKELHQAFSSDAERLHFVADSFLNIICCKIARQKAGRFWEFVLGTVSHLDTQIRQRHLVRSLVRMYQFNVVHEPIPVSPKLPSMMFGLSVPVVIGPMNGGMDYPENYDLTTRFERFMTSMLRSTAAFWNVVVRGKLDAALLLVANRRTLDALPSNLRKKHVLELVENGVDLDLFSSGTTRINCGPIQFIYVGRLVDFKRVDLLIAACSELIGKLDFHLHVVGDGPLRGALEQQIQRQSLTRHVQLHGRLPQSVAAQILRSADIMVLPSMRECGGAVVLEAMASGLPVIATNWGGPADYITNCTGILIPPATPEVFVSDLANAMLSLAENPKLRADMGRKSRQRVELHYDWRVKAKTILQIYRGVVSGKMASVKHAVE